MNSWNSYPKIYSLGHPAIVDLLNGEVLVEEKIDGSQFSFGLFGDTLRIRSKGMEMVVDAPESMFSLAAQTVRELAPLLREEWTYRAEFLQKPKHNTLAYDRIPTRHLILFDVSTAPECYLSWDEAGEARRLGIDVVPRIFSGIIESVDIVREWLEQVSCLGGQKIEGVVIKNYARFGVDGKVLLGKHVSEAFKEVHKKDWRERNPTRTDVVELLIEKYRTPARWQKAVQHLAERGKLENSPRDIAALIKEAQADLLIECEAEIKADLFEFVRAKVMRGVIRGLPEWYKDRLLELQFEGGELEAMRALVSAPPAEAK